MGLFDGLISWGKQPRMEGTNQSNWLQVDQDGMFYWHMNRMLSGFKDVPKFDKTIPYYYAVNLAEIFIPIDTIASRVASVRYVLTNKNTGEEVENIPVNLQRLLKNPNPFYKFEDLVYRIIFSELASGQSYTLTKKPDSVNGKSYDNITNIWSLNPDLTSPIMLKSIPDPFLIKSKSELLKGYKTNFIVDRDLLPDEVNHHTITELRNNLKSISPLESVERNINNLLAVYSARLNVYEKNGSSLILAKERGVETLSEQVDPVTRQMILDDMRQTDGLTGNKNFVGISSFPLKAIETLGKIKDLEPFRETFTDMITIGGIYEVDKELLPKEQSTTFANKKDVEKHLWQNTIIPYSDDLCQVLNDVYWLPEDMEFTIDVSHIPILQTDKKTEGEADKLTLENIEKSNQLKEQGLTNEILNKWD